MPFEELFDAATRVLGKAVAVDEDMTVPDLDDVTSNRHYPLDQNGPESGALNTTTSPARAKCPQAA